MRSFRLLDMLLCNTRSGLVLASFCIFLGSMYNMLLAISQDESISLFYLGHSFNAIARGRVQVVIGGVACNPHIKLVLRYVWIPQLGHDNRSVSCPDGGQFQGAWYLTNTVYGRQAEDAQLLMGSNLGTLDFSSSKARYRRVGGGPKELSYTISVSVIVTGRRRPKLVASFSARRLTFRVTSSNNRRTRSRSRSSSLS